MSESRPLNDLGAKPPYTTPSRLASTHMTSHPRATYWNKDSSMAGLPQHYNYPGSKCKHKLQTGERYHKCTKHPPTSISAGYLNCHSMGQGGWVSKIVSLSTLEAKWRIINIFQFHVRVPYPEQMKRPSPRPAKH